MNQQTYDNMTPTFIDNDFISKADHQLALAYISDDVEQLIAELYDSCENIDRDSLHEILIDICDQLNMTDTPDIKTLKINKEV